jgi:hypothetical protein
MEMSRNSQRIEEYHKLRYSVLVLDSKQYSMFERPGTWGMPKGPITIRVAD